MQSSNSKTRDDHDAESHVRYVYCGGEPGGDQRLANDCEIHDLVNEREIREQHGRLGLVRHQQLQRS